MCLQTANSHICFQNTKISPSRACFHLSPSPMLKTLRPTVRSHKLILYKLIVSRSCTGALPTLLLSALEFLTWVPEPDVIPSLPNPKLKSALGSFRIILPEVISLPKPSWWAKAYPDLMDRLVLLAEGVLRTSWLWRDLIWAIRCFSLTRSERLGNTSTK